MGLFDWIGGSTPAGIASETGQKVVAGIFDGIEGLISEFHLSPQEAQQFKLRLMELKLQAYQTQVSDTQSARQMQMTNRSLWPGIITLLIIFGYFGLLILMIVHGIPSTTAPGGEVLLTLIGVLATAFPIVLHFWLGGTRSEADSTQMLSQSVPMSAVQSLTPPPSQSPPS